MVKEVSRSQSSKRSWPSERNSDLRTLSWTILLPAPVIGVAVTAWIGLGIDVKYALGGLQTAESGGAGSAVDTFVHRPLAFRTLLVSLDSVREAIGLDAASPLAQFVIRILMCSIVAVAAAMLWWGLRRHLEESTARLVAVSTGTALALASNFHFLTADWVGVVAALAAVGAALAPRNLGLAYTLSGALLVLTVAVKIATAPWALLAVCIIAYWSWNRAAGAAVTSVIIGGAWLAATAFFDPIEIVWLLDSVRATSPSSADTGFSGELLELVKLLANIAIVSPILAVAPGAIATVLHSGAVTRKTVTGFLLIGALGLACASGIAQGEGFSYHFSGLPVLAAAIVAGAIASAESSRDRHTLLISTAMSGVVSGFLLAAPLDWRRESFGAVTVLYILISLVTLANVLRRPPQNALPTRRWPSSVGAGSLAITLSFVAAGLPSSAYAFDGFDDNYTNIGLVRDEAVARSEYDRARARIGSSSVVLYLTYGTTNYMLQNPASCRYPSPVFMARSVANPEIQSLETYRDNLTCFDDPADYLAVDRAWADPDRMEQQVKDAVGSRFDCERSFTIRDGAATIEFCPKR